MKKMFLILLLLPFLVLAQEQLDTTQNRIVVTEDVNDCVQKIYDNPDAIKLLMTTIMSDKDKMKHLHQELMNDPAFRQMIQDVRSDMHDSPHQEMNNQDTQDQNMNDQNQDTQKEEYVPPTEPVPPTDVPPTEVPPTDQPPTEVPPTDQPPTEVPPTYQTPTNIEADTTGNG